VKEKNDKFEIDFLRFAETRLKIHDWHSIMKIKIDVVMVEE